MTVKKFSFGQWHQINTSAMHFRYRLRMLSDFRKCSKCSKCSLISETNMYFLRYVEMNFSNFRCVKYVDNELLKSSLLRSADCTVPLPFPLRGSQSRALLLWGRQPLMTSSNRAKLRWKIDRKNLPKSGSWGGSIRNRSGVLSIQLLSDPTRWRCACVPTGCEELIRWPWQPLTPSRSKLARESWICTRAKLVRHQSNLAFSIRPKE